AHSAIQSTDRTAGSVGNAVNGINASGNAEGSASGSGSAAGGSANGNGSAGMSSMAGGGLNTADAAGKAGEAGRGVGGTVRDAAHSAIQSTDRTAGSVGNAVNGINASGNAQGSANGHMAAQTQPRSGTDGGHRHQNRKSHASSDNERQ
ncbi:MAG: hypothetical protein KGJ46_13580, partial [Xanthomonadaceae bacterium]|nr:hypothetical protein [Xanthomonadaceae bacterium]